LRAGGDASAAWRTVLLGSTPTWRRGRRSRPPILARSAPRGGPHRAVRIAQRELATSRAAAFESAVICCSAATRSSPLLVQDDERRAATAVESRTERAGRAPPGAHVQIVHRHLRQLGCVRSPTTLPSSQPPSSNRNATGSAGSAIANVSLTFVTVTSRRTTESRVITRIVTGKRNNG
jgi:hypothetical protein